MMTFNRSTSNPPRNSSSRHRSVTVDGFDIREVAKDSLWDQLGIVPQRALRNAYFIMNSAKVPIKFNTGTVIPVLIHSIRKQDGTINHATGQRRRTSTWGPGGGGPPATAMERLATC